MENDELGAAAKLRPRQEFPSRCQNWRVFQIFLEKNMNKHSLFVNPPLKWGLDDGFVSWKVEFWGFEGWYIMDFCFAAGTPDFCFQH